MTGQTAPRGETSEAANITAQLQAQTNAGMPGDVLESRQSLTPRQTEVVRLAVLGLTSKQIARRLGISKNTVDEHLRDARRRVGATTKSRLICWAVASGLATY